MKKNETVIGKMIYDKGLRKEFVIEQTGINRSDFYKGMKYPVLFSDVQLRRIAKVIGKKSAELLSLKYD